MFAGRANELKKLDGIYESGKFECVVIHGRWRAGKTELIKEFMSQSKEFIYFAALETSETENMENLVRCIEAYPRYAKTRDIRSYEDAFEQLGKLARSERLLFVIDDYQYLVSSQRGITTLLCRLIEQRLKDTKMMILICGSSEPVMSSEALGYDSPFHGIRTAQLEVPPFSFFELKRHYSSFSPFDIAVVYGVTGGVPSYIDLMDPAVPVEENIQRAFFDPASALFEEPANILRREVRDPAYYNAILSAIASGKSKNSEIASAVGLETSACTAYLRNLMAIGLVGKYTPVTERAGRKTIYEIKDNMFRFWYRFVPRNMSLIRSGMANRIWRSVAREIPAFMSKVFEDICRVWLEQQDQAGKLPVRIDETGRWWGIDPVLKTEASVPILAYSGDEHAFFGDCVWSDEPAQVGALVSLSERSRLFRFADRHLYLFSRSGFSDECVDTAKRLGANLVMFE